MLVFYIVVPKITSAVSVETMHLSPFRDSGPPVPDPTTLLNWDWNHQHYQRIDSISDSELKE